MEAGKGFANLRISLNLTIGVFVGSEEWKELGMTSLFLVEHVDEYNAFF
jgi:hypothetical protein